MRIHRSKVMWYCLTLPTCNNQPYPSDPGREGALSEELEEVETTEEATEVTDSLRSVEDRMYGSTMEPARLGFLSVKLGG